MLPCGQLNRGAKEIAAVFKARTGDDAVLSFASSDHALILFPVVHPM